MSPMVITLLAAVLGFITVAGFGFVFLGGDTAQTRTLKRAQTIVGRGEARAGGEAAGRDRAAGEASAGDEAAGRGR